MGYLGVVAEVLLQNECKKAFVLLLWKCMCSSLLLVGDLHNLAEIKIKARQTSRTEQKVLSYHDL